MPASDDDSASTPLLPLSAAPCGLESALRDRGFESLSPIQTAVVAEDAVGRDLRITSQTGSGKTVAVGLAIAEVVSKAADHKRIARPTALVIAPTRELAAQLDRELSWLYAPLGKSVTVVTGGTSYTKEKRALSNGPHVLVGTPGRLLDHLKRDAVSLDDLQAVVLDEADEMLDMGFEEELNAILAHATGEHLTHLVSATFSKEAVRLAEKLQKNPVALEGTPLGAANTDIEHRCISVHYRDQLDVIVNLLLRFLGDKTLIFVRTRARTSELAAELADLGFKALALSGEMSQRERTSTYQRFRRGLIDVLVATDVAARGLDVQDIAQVIQADLPDDPDAFTHRSGRTGRAGQTGRNILLVPPRGERRASMVLRRAKVDAEFVDAPSVESIQKAGIARLEAELEQPHEYGDRLTEVAERLLAQKDPVRIVEKLLARVGFEGPTEAREIRKKGKNFKGRDRNQKKDRGDRDHGGKGDHGSTGGKGGRNHRDDGDYVAFQASWGEQAGANPQRMLAVICRRGDVDRNAVGRIRVGPRSSMLEIKAEAAEAFEKAMARPDDRDGHVSVRRWKFQGGGKSRDGGGGGHKHGRKSKHKKRWNKNKKKHRGND